MTLIENQILDAERALYHLQDACVSGCSFAGPADGESALKEARGITVSDSHFLLRYPLWHVSGFTLRSCDMAETARAALWYSENGTIEGSSLHGIKCLRECSDILLRNTSILSAEFGWRCRRITLENCDMLGGEYFMFQSENVTLKNVRMKGKYSFQYNEGLVIEDSFLDTKDAFWHTKGATVRNSTVKGEYLGWYSEGLTLDHCHIIGTQPLCYCKDLTLIDCTMEACDLAFEYSTVNATVNGHIDSVKNPLEGSVTADSIGEIILADSIYPCFCRISQRQNGAVS